MSAEARVTTDHEEIRNWVEERGGNPARVKSTDKGGSGGLLRIDYPGFSGEDTLEEITWDEFFVAFDDNNLNQLKNVPGDAFEVVKMDRLYTAADCP